MLGHLLLSFPALLQGTFKKQLRLQPAVGKQTQLSHIIFKVPGKVFEEVPRRASRTFHFSYRTHHPFRLSLVTQTMRFPRSPHHSGISSPTIVKYLSHFANHMFGPKLGLPTDGIYWLFSQLIQLSLEPNQYDGLA